MQIGIFLSLAGKTTNPIAPVVPFSAVSLLMGFEGADASTSFVDESGLTHTCTANGNAQIDTAQSKFGTSSGLFDGSGDYVSIPDHAGFEFGAGQFTVEFFARWNNLTSPANQGLVGKQSNSSSGIMWGFYWISPDMRFRLSTSNTGASPTDLTYSPGHSNAVWYHWAADRDASNVVRLYLDGAMVASTTFAGTFPDTSGSVWVGRIQTAAVERPFNGWVDELRVTKGYARYASNSGFTVPAAAYPRS